VIRENREPRTMKPLAPHRLSLLSALFAAAASLSLIGGATTFGQEAKKANRPPLEMSKAVVCKKVEGYEKFQPLPDAAVTSEDKLLVYYRPINFKVEPVDKPRPGFRYRAKFAQDGRVRRKGEKTVLSKKDLILEYEPFYDTPFNQIYLVNTVGLKGLPPGEYEYDIILRDVLDEGSSSTQTLLFTIIPIPKVDPLPKKEEPDEPESPPGSKTGSNPPKKSAKSR
jgi:hypothetical protein